MEEFNLILHISLHLEICIMFMSFYYFIFKSEKEIYSVLGTVLRTFHIKTHFTLTTII